MRRTSGWGRGLVTQHESSGDELVYDREVDGRRHRVVARIEDGKRTMALPVPGRVLLRAHRPEPEAPVLVDAVTLAWPDAAVVELAAG